MAREIELVLALMIGVALLAMLSRKVPVPYPVLLVLGGLGLAFSPHLPRVSLNPDMVFLLFLPPLLYPAALFTPWRDFKSNLRPISLLSIGLVIFTTVAVGYLMHFLIPQLSLAACFTLGAIISPTDAIAVTAVAERIRMPSRILAVLEGESLVNDASALVAFRFAVAALVTGTFSPTEAIFKFAYVGLGGVGVGLIVGVVTFLVQKRINDPPVEITFSLITPFAAYLSAEEAGVSGVMAVVATGLYHGWRIPEFTSSRTRLQAGPIWRMIEFLLNGIIFLLIGLQLPEVITGLHGYSKAQLLTYGCLLSASVILIRFIWVFPATYIPRFLFPSLRKRDPYPAARNVAIVAWTGMRGVVSLAAALALPETLPNGTPFPGRNLILFLTFAVIMATLVVQGLTLPSLLKVLGVRDDGTVLAEEHDARLKANEAALAHLATRRGAIGDSVFNRLMMEYEDRVQQLAAGQDGQASAFGMFSSEYEQALNETLQVERATLIQLRNTDRINDEVLRKIQRDIDLAEARMDRPDT
jgi:Na+/H+ antiporter